MTAGYYETPNVNIPYNDREPGQIADIAWEQLKPYHIAAQTWPVGEEYRDGRQCNICRKCNQNIWFTTDPANIAFMYEEDAILSLITAHVRQVHAKEVVT